MANDDASTSATQIVFVMTTAITATPIAAKPMPTRDWRAGRSPNTIMPSTTLSSGLRK